MTAEPVSRRQVLKAGAGAAAAAGVLGTSALAYVASPAGPASSASSASPAAVMVRLRGEAAGVLDLFVGTERLELRDAELAARIAAAARPLF